jgi:hypothetical protein
VRIAHAQLARHRSANQERAPGRLLPGALTVGPRSGAHAGRLQHAHPLQAHGLSQPQAGAHRHPPFACGLQAQASWLHFEQEQSGFAFFDMTGLLSEH